MADTDKTIEVIKAAMEKEMGMKDYTKGATDENLENNEGTSDNEATTAQDEMTEDCVMDEILDELSDSEEDSIQGESKGDKNSSSKGFFKNNKNKELAAKDLKIDDLTDRLMRQMAEFENYRKRTEKEKAQMYTVGAKEVIEKLLPIVDNFERGLGTLSEKEKEGAFAQGIELIYKQFILALEEMGVKPIEAVGKEFDPNFHNAVMHGEDDTLGENIISDEFQKGYMYRDIVIRYSMVKVVN